MKKSCKKCRRRPFVSFLFYTYAGIEQTTTQFCSYISNHMFYLFQAKYFFENKLDQVRDKLLCGWLKKKIEPFKDCSHYYS